MDDVIILIESKRQYAKARKRLFSVRHEAREYQWMKAPPRKRIVTALSIESWATSGNRDSQA